MQAPTPWKELCFMGGKLLILLALGMSLILQGLIRYIVKKKENIENICQAPFCSSLLSLKKFLFKKEKIHHFQMEKMWAFKNLYWLSLLHWLKNFKIVFLSHFVQHHFLSLANGGLQGGHAWQVVRDMVSEMTWVCELSQQPSQEAALKCLKQLLICRKAAAAAAAPMWHKKALPSSEVKAHPIYLV